MSNDPNIDDMERHLRCLYDWTESQYPNALFEVRCIHPISGTSKDERFACTGSGYEQAVCFAVQQNDRGYNCYVTANPLKPGTAHAANDEDVEIALYQCIDADGVDDPDILIAERSQGFHPSFIVRTGTIPKPRCQVFWRQSQPITDMVQWRGTQAGLAQQFDTDQTIKNPSRVLRLAGTISHPSSHKRERGYVTEVTSLDRNDNGDVCANSFAASFACAEPPRAAPGPHTYRPVSDDGSGKLPLCVVEAALTVSWAGNSAIYGWTSRKPVETPIAIAGLCSTSGSASRTAMPSLTAKSGIP
jgi:RepB DNA-primase from phage plasmid